MMGQHCWEAHDLDYQLPKPIAELLMAMVETAERDEVLTVFCFSCQSAEESGAFDLSIGAGAEPLLVKRLRGNPIASLQQLGFLERLGQNNVFLYPAAFAWAKYERMGQFGKWARRVYHRGRDVVLIVVSTLTVLLTILRIVELLK